MAWADYYAQLYNSRTQAYHANGVAIDEVMWKAIGEPILIIFRITRRYHK